MSRLPATRKMAAVVALGALSLSAACGSSEEQKATPSTGSKGLGTIRVVLSEGHSAPFIAADAGNLLGVWDGTGLTVENITATSATVGPTMAAGQADISIQAGNKAAGDILAGVDCTLAAGIMLPWDQYVVAGKKTGATKAEDLKGKSFGITGFGSAAHFATLTMAKNLGWSESDYKIAQLGNLDGLLAGLQSGTIDAFLWSLEPGLRAQEKGFGTVLTSVKDLVGPNVFEGSCVSNKVQKERPEAVKAYFEGYFKAVKILQDDPGRARKIMVDEWKFSSNVADESVSRIVPLLSPDGVIPPKNLKGLAEAVSVTVKGAGNNIDLTKDYKYWKDVG